MNKCWLNNKDEEFEYWSREDKGFNIDEGLTFVATGDALLTRRLKPFAAWIVLHKRGKFSNTCGLLVPAEKAAEIIEEVEHHRATRRPTVSAEERRQTRSHLSVMASSAQGSV